MFLKLGNLQFLGPCPPEYMSFLSPPPPVRVRMASGKMAPLWVCTGSLHNSRISLLLWNISRGRAEYTGGEGCRSVGDKEMLGKGWGGGQAKTGSGQNLTKARGPHGFVKSSQLPPEVDAILFPFSR